MISVYAALVLFLPTFGPPFLAARRAAVPWAVVAHLVGGLTALALGPWQFNRHVRARTMVHRWLGRIYVAAVMVGGLGALALAPSTQEGAVTHAGFAALALLWLGATAQAYRRIRAGDVPSHKQWMMRSFALTLAAVTLRIYLPVALAAGATFHDAYRVISWACWVPNVVVVEWVLRRSRRGVAVTDGVAV